MSRTLVFHRDRSNFRVDTFRCGGPGGQCQNKRDTGVRITDLETGLAAECRVHRTQEQNKKEAFRKLVDKLVEFYAKKPDKIRQSAPNAVIRTYNEHDDRVVDYRTGKKFSYKHTIGKGDFSEIIEATK